MKPEESQQRYEKVKGILELSPNQEVTIWIIKIEDAYESVFGDGRYIYPEKAFLSYKVASAWVRWIGSRTEESLPFTGYLATIEGRVLRLGPGGIIVECRPDEHGRHQEMPFTSFELLDDHPVGGWDDIVQWCCKQGKVRPDWKDQWELIPNQEKKT
ncbi:MAG TPA: hypothetical protein PKE55_09825 [Kiritimatiellia bacterium]|nr:hypothetical protein [Kiritimatiellia bacterium]